MKKTLAVLFAAALFALALCTCASAETLGDWAYRLDEDGFAHITAYLNSDVRSVEIPKKVDGHYVTGIDEGAFSSGISSVLVPGTVMEIADGAFGNDTRLRAYNGSAALDYAKKHGLSSKNLSTLEFTPAVVDFTGLSSGEYSYTSSGIRLHKAHAKRLKTGSLFFLPPDRRNEMGDGYVVRSMSANGDWVNIAMAEADPALILERISVNVKNLQPDYDNIIVLDKAVSNLQVTPRAAIGGIGKDLSFTYKDGALTANFNIGLMLDGLILEVDMMPFKVEEFVCQTTLDARSEIIFQRKAHFEKDILDVPFMTVAGVVKARAIVTLTCDVTGTITLNARFATTNTVSYDEDEGWSYEMNGADYDCSVNGKVEFEPELAIPTLAISVPVAENIAEFSLLVALPTKAEASFEPLHPATQVCADLTMDLTMELSAWVGLYKEDVLDMRLKWRSGRVPVWSDNWHMEDGMPVEACTKHIRKLCFDAGFDLSLPPVYGEPDMEVAIPSAYYGIVRPGYTLLGWYRYPAGTENNEEIPRLFTPVEDVTTIYALWQRDDTPEQDFSVPLDPSEIPAADTAASSAFRGVFRVNTHDMSNITFPTLADYAKVVPYNGTTEADYLKWVEGYGSLHAFYSFGNAGNTSITSRAWAEGYTHTDGAAYNTNLTSVSLPSTLTRVGSFKHCTSLPYIALPPNLDDYSGDIFYGCTSLENIAPLPAGFSSITSNTFGGCVSLKTLDFSATSLTTIPSEAFYGLTSLKEVRLPATLTSIGDGAFSHTAIENIALPASVTSIRGGFKDAQALKEVTIPSVLQDSYSAFENCVSLETVNLPAGTTELGGNMFKNCYNLASITLPDNKLSIGASCFENCVSLHGMSTLDIEVSTIGQYAFRNVRGLNTVILRGDEIRIDQGAFINSDIETLIIDCDTLYIHGLAFSGCPQLKEIDIRARTADVSFEDLSILTRASVQCSESARICFYRCEAMTDLSVVCPQIDKLVVSPALSLTNLHLEGAVKEGELFYPAFKEFKHHMNGEDFNLRIFSYMLERVEITGKLGSIGKGVFSGCKNLTEVVLPEMTGSIKESAFSKCGFTEFVVPEGATAIEAVAFGYCASLETITIPDSVTDIFGGFSTNYYSQETYKYGAFDGCSALKWVNCIEGGPIDQLAYSTGIAAGNPETATLYTLHFAGKEAPLQESIEAEPGQTVVLPTIFLRANQPYVFAGWFADEACTESVSSPYIMPDHDTTLYSGVTLRIVAPNAAALVVDGDTLVSYDSSGVFFVPDGITTIKSGAIGPSVEIVHLPASVSSIEPGAFAQASALHSFFVDGANPYFYASDDALYAAGGTLVACPQQLRDALVMHEGATAIGADAFNWANGANIFHTLRIPDSVTSAAPDAFDHLDQTTKIYGPLDGPVAEAAMNVGLPYNRYLVLFMTGDEFIGAAETTAGRLLPEVPPPSRANMIFRGWSLEEDGKAINLNSFTMPRDTLLVYAVWSENNTEDYVWLTLPQNLSAIEAHAFSNTPVQAVRCPEALERIETCAFQNCSNMTYIIIPSPDTVIESDAFSGCNHSNFTICSPEDGLAHQFAQENGIIWVPLE